MDRSGMNFRKWLETVGGVRRLKDAGWQPEGYPSEIRGMKTSVTLSELGTFGWFRAYSASDSSGYDPEWGVSLYGSDWFAEGFDGRLLVEVTQRLMSLGFRPLRVSVIFHGSVPSKDAEGTHEPQLHVIRVKKGLDEGRMMHVLAHEWAHAVWKSMPKQDKESFEKYWVGSFGRRGSGLSSYAFTGGPKEMFCEMVAEAVANPSALSREEAKLVRMVAGGSMPVHSLGEAVVSSEDVGSALRKTMEMQVEGRWSDVGVKREGHNPPVVKFMGKLRNERTGYGGPEYFYVTAYAILGGRNGSPLFSYDTASGSEDLRINGSILYLNGRGGYAELGVRSSDHHSQDLSSSFGQTLRTPFEFAKWVEAVVGRFEGFGDFDDDGGDDDVEPWSPVPSSGSRLVPA